MVKTYNGEMYIIPPAFEKEVRADERAKVLDEISEKLQELYHSSEHRHLNDLEYGFNKGINSVEDLLEELKEQK